MGPSRSSDLVVDFTLSRTLPHLSIKRLQHLLRYVAAKETVRGQLGVWLCTDEEIADLHLRFMDISGATDVITFPEDSPDSEGYLGDIAVSVDTAEAQARDAGHTQAREIAYLCVHGLLHIAGYDDQTNHEKQRMFERQETLLSEFERSEPGKWAVSASGQSGDDDPQRG